MNAEIKEIIAVTLLVLGILQGTNAVVSEERTMDGILRTVLLLGAALLVYLWLMRDQRSAEEIVEETLDEVEKQLDVVKEAVKDAKEQAKERVEEAKEYIVGDTPDKPAPPPTPVKQPKAAPAVGVPGETASPSAIADDLTMIEGIGPSYRDILVRSGVDTFAKLAAMNTDEITQVIRDNGGRKSASMTTWAQQAKLAAAGDWDGLERLKQQLKGGK